LAGTSSEKERIYSERLGRALNDYFPEKRIRQKSNDPPWYNSTVRKQLDRNRNLFRKEGRSPTWKAVNSKTQELIEARRKVFVETQKQKLTAAEDSDLEPPLFVYQGLYVYVLRSIFNWMFSSCYESFLTSTDLNLIAI
jgi:hypothetical protein